MTVPAEDPQKDHPDVVVFPPILLFALIAVGVILDRFFPLGILAQLPVTPRLVAGAILLVFGASFPIMTRLAFARAGSICTIRMFQSVRLKTSSIPSYLANMAACFFQHSATSFFVGLCVSQQGWLLVSHGGN
jgi:hypothetical protein